MFEALLRDLNIDYGAAVENAEDQLNNMLGQNQSHIVCGWTQNVPCGPATV